MDHLIILLIGTLCFSSLAKSQGFTESYSDILSAHTTPPYCPDYYKVDENFVACCGIFATLTSGFGPGHVASPACCWEAAATCTGAAPPMYDWTIVEGSVSTISQVGPASVPASVTTHSSDSISSTPAPTGSSPTTAPTGTTAVSELCSDPKWAPSPENWEDANVDTELSNWWASTAAARGSATFVDWISQSFGDRSRNQQCGIGLIASCVVPDCQAFQNAGGPRWVYFVRISLMEMNTLFNNIKTAMQDAETDLAHVLPDMAANFFPWKDPKTNLEKALPFIQAMVCGALSIIPTTRVFAALEPAVQKWTTRLVEGTKEFTGAGVSIVASSPSSGGSKLGHQMGSVQELGTLVKTTTEAMRTGLEGWAKTVFNGEADTSGKTILDYLAAGRFTFDYNIPASWMDAVFFKIQVSKFVNGQWSKDNKAATSRTFVMCANATDSPCSDKSQYSEDGRTCCLYSVDKDGKYVSPLALDKLAEPTYNITAAEITASSLHSYLAEGLTYDESKIVDKIQESISVNESQSLLFQGAQFQGVWTLPVCDVGANSGWVADYDARMLPCCCGVGCAETTEFFDAAGIEKHKAVHDGCVAQFAAFSGSERSRGLGRTLLWLVGTAWVLLLGVC